jgi:hypothetical protein
MSFAVGCPATGSEPEISQPTQLLLVTQLTNHLNSVHAGFSWSDYWVQRNCHSAPWRVPCPVVRTEPPISGSARGDLVKNVGSHVGLHANFSWARDWYVPANCHSTPTPVRPGG